ncbi:MAG: fused MFS/spermidine synthase [Verrucomicrobiota bacterium]|nr:fused MFS/spermidine synthase [Verrucomicrobiota bacterium]
MKTRPLFIALLLFGSGLAALAYQTVWLREFRLIFGSSTPASAAVLAIFMGGLGAGGLFLGGRADRQARPLRFYAQLEFLIALAAALSPFLIWLARAAYLAIGGSAEIGTLPATIVRLLLSTLVIGVPTFLMGGTLPAAGRAIETETDISRRRLALVYGTNTLGAVAGVLLATFYFLEHFGNHLTLWFACGLNLVVALGAFALSRSTAPVQATAAAPRKSKASPNAEPKPAPLTLLLISAAVVGFAFLLMELVWYRMMGPLLGGTTFTFGLILAVALFGIGLGSASYSWFVGSNQPRLGAFALTCAAEAFFLALPYALGDRLAVLTLLLRPLGAFGFIGHVFAWTQIVSIVVLPAAFIAGVQFPLLIALLGKGRQNIGAQTGLIYACNTLGAIVGSLAGGFGLLPLLSATGAWKFTVVVLALLGIATWIVSLRHDRRVSSILAPAAITIVTLWMLTATGPTPAWRQSPIGAGRSEDTAVTSPNTREEWLRQARRYIIHQEDGVESCLGISVNGGISFLINGKSDGNSLYDASTQVMLGVLGATLQPEAKRSLVVGLGSGSTAGWLGAVPTMEHVDVVELERAVLKVAKMSALVNENVLTNPKVKVTIGDAREVLLTSRQQYDLIVSEPSNPYRAGIAGLYTKEYYEAAARRLRPTGMFLQFVQAYEVDSSTIRSIYASVTSVFPVVETWQLNGTDLLFIGSSQPMHYDADLLRERLTQEPFNRGFFDAWQVADVEGLFSHYVANSTFATQMAREPGTVVNTDDRNFVEFGFARSVGRAKGFEIPLLREAAHRRKADRPLSLGGTIDWQRVDSQNAAISLLGQTLPAPYSFLDQNQLRRVAAETAYIEGNVSSALQLWRSQPGEPDGPALAAMVAELFGAVGEDDALKHIATVRASSPTEADMLLGLLRFSQGRLTEATDALKVAFTAARRDPWPLRLVMIHSISVAEHIARQNPSLAPQLYDALEQPFALFAAESERRQALALIAAEIDRGHFSEYSRKAIAAYEPDVPWDREFLRVRRDCYRALSDPRADLAERELAQFIANEPPPLETSAPPVN